MKVRKGDKIQIHLL